jgi:hypothetical protein
MIDGRYLNGKIEHEPEGNACTREGLLERIREAVAACNVSQ